MPAGISARSRAEDEGLHIHPGRLDMSQGRGGARDVHHCGRYSRGHQRDRTHPDHHESRRLLRRDRHSQPRRSQQVCPLLRYFCTRRKVTEARKIMITRGGFKFTAE